MDIMTQMLIMVIMTQMPTMVHIVNQFLIQDLAHLDLMDSDPQHVVALAQVLCVVACMVVVGLDSMSSQERTLSETQDKNLSNSTSWCPSNSSAHLGSVEEGMP